MYYSARLVPRPILPIRRQPQIFHADPSHTTEYRQRILAGISDGGGQIRQNPARWRGLEVHRRCFQHPYTGVEGNSWLAARYSRLSPHCSPTPSLVHRFAGDLSTLLTAGQVAQIRPREHRGLMLLAGPERAAQYDFQISWGRVSPPRTSLESLLMSLQGHWWPWSAPSPSAALHASQQLVTTATTSSGCCVLSGSQLRPVDCWRLQVHTVQWRP